jgi:hypothetical protein
VFAFANSKDEVLLLIGVLRHEASSSLASGYRCRGGGTYTATATINLYLYKLCLLLNVDSIDKDCRWRHGKPFLLHRGTGIVIAAGTHQC